MPLTPGPSFSRRSVLLGAAGLAGSVALAACGSSSSSTSADTVPLTPDDGSSTLFPIFASDASYAYLVSGSPQRLAFGINGPDGTPLDGSSTPASLDFQLSKDGQDIGTPTTVLAHSDGVPIGFYPYRTTFAEPGSYQVAVTLNGTPTTVPFDVLDPSGSKLVPRGGAMVAVETPTVTDARGVQPICTQPSGTCAFHSLTVTQALASGKPTALLVATPQFCQIGVCGPVLDLLLEIGPHFPSVQIIHAEVYTNAQAILNSTNDTSSSGTPASPAEATQSATLAPVVDAYGLTFEPALFLANASGTVVDRLDNIFDRGEIKLGLQAIA